MDKEGLPTWNYLGYRTIRYICESSPLGGWHENRFINSADVVYSHPPECYEKPCHECGKRMWREDVWKGLWDDKKTVDWVTIEKARQEPFRQGTTLRRLSDGAQANRKRGNRTLESNYQEAGSGDKGIDGTVRETVQVAGRPETGTPGFEAYPIPGGIDDPGEPPPELGDEDFF